MTIEFHTPFGKVSEKLVNIIRNEVLELLHINKNISRAEIFLKEIEGIISGEDKVCEIRLNVYGNNLVAHTPTENFERSAKEAVKELKRLLKQHVKKQKEIADEIISTVKV